MQTARSSCSSLGVSAMFSVPASPGLAGALLEELPCAQERHPEPAEPGVRRGSQQAGGGQGAQGQFLFCCEVEPLNA